MSQSRFSIVLVGVSALLRRPLVSRLRPADGERSSWVVFAARVGRFDSGFRWAGWPSGSLLRRFRSVVGASAFRFGVAAGRVRSSAFRFGVATGRVRSSVFRFGDCHSSGWPSGSPLPFSACAASEWLLGEFVLPPSASEIALGGLAFGLTASAFRHALLRSGRWTSSFFRLLFRSCRSAGWPSGSLLPLFGTHRSAPPHRRREDRRSTTTQHLFYFKHLSQHVNLPHRSP